MAQLIISVSGLRGIVGESLTADVAERFSSAYAEGLAAGPVVITRDGRANGPQLLAPVVRGLARAGVARLWDAGIAATPTTGVLVRRLSAAGGVQISASHNPAEYNGLKLFSPDGRVLPGAAGAEVLARYKTSPDQLRGSAENQSQPVLEPVADTISDHLSLVADIVNVGRIRERQFRVLLDANHGAGSLLGRQLLEHLGCRVTILGDKPDGAFAHLPEPTVDNLTGVLRRVVDAEADIGFCQDPDADRLAIIDEQGRYLGEEHTLALCADYVLRATPGPVVINCSTSRMTEDLARRHGVPFHRSAVGEANVVDTMLAVGAVLGGEGNGGVIDPRVGLVRDSFVAMALVLDNMADRGVAVSEWAHELPRYAISKTKVDCAGSRVAAALDALENHFSTATVDRMDGLRLDWPDSWLLVRASNTEPIVRVVAEAPAADKARQLCEQAAQVMHASD